MSDVIFFDCGNAIFDCGNAIFDSKKITPIRDQKHPDSQSKNTASQHFLK